MTAHQIHVIILDDHALVARSLCQYLQMSRPDLNVQTAMSWADLERWVHRNGCPALVVADIWLGNDNSLQNLAAWRQRCNRTRWLSLSGDDSPGLAERARQAGAQGFVHKQATPEVLGNVMDRILAGHPWSEVGICLESQHGPALRPSALTLQQGLTPRQREVFALVLRGLPNKRIASTLDIAESTVKAHVTELLSRLGVRTRIEAITLYQSQHHRSQP
jgi:DNA-binding NarL/FixJ family response regulator